MTTTACLLRLTVIMALWGLMLYLILVTVAGPDLTHLSNDPGRILSHPLAAWLVR